jgi:predicted ribosome quality control (RQC) complex YloA/Tae2 family protein
LFGNGNVILCNESLKILALINPINVRHRVLKPGLNYAPPPPRGVNPFSINFENFLSLVNTTKEEGEGNIDIKKWLGRNLSISKKFVEHIINNSGIKTKKSKKYRMMNLKVCLMS